LREYVLLPRKKESWKEVGREEHPFSKTRRFKQGKNEESARRNIIEGGGDPQSKVPSKEIGEGT